MKVFRRVVVKILIFLLVVAAAGGGAAGWQAYRQGTPDYAMDKYLSYLIDNNADKAYVLLDQSEDGSLTKSEYASALEGKKYSLYSGYKTEEMEKRRDSDGNEYTDYHVEFVNAGDEVQLEEDFTVKKQADPLFGVFDQWKILSGHCMVKNFRVTVPAGSEVYLDGEKADAAWIDRDGVQASYDSYVIPTLLPGKISLVIRHVALESVNTTLDTTDGGADYSDKMDVKQSAKDECKEIGISALKQLYASSATEKTEELEDLFDSCLDAAKKIVKEQAKLFHKEDAVFKNAGISDFAAQYGELVFTEEKNGALTMEMTLSYHYVVHEDVTTDTDELQEDGTPVQVSETEALSGDNKAVFTMAFYDDEWHIDSVKLSAIPKSN